VKLLIEHIKDLKAREKVVKYIQYDNARENVAFEQACKKEGLGVLYTSPTSLSSMDEWKESLLLCIQDQEQY
jgi:hypothetical protein